MLRIIAALLAVLCAGYAPHHAPPRHVVCLLPSVEANYQELDVARCVNTGKRVTARDIQAANYAPDCYTMRVTYVPCYKGGN